MKTMLLLLFAFVFIQAIAVGQADEVRITKINLSDTAFVGQMLSVFMTGVGENNRASIAEERFEARLMQGGMSFTAIVRSVSIGALPVTDSPDGQPKLKSQKIVLLTLPKGLREGEAELVILYRGRSSNAYKLKITEKLPTPMIARIMATPVVSTQQLLKTKEELKKELSGGLVFERGKAAALHITPMIDPEEATGMVLATFKQGELTREVTAKIVRYEPNKEVWAPAMYELQVPVPAELMPGAAELEVRLRLNGQTSEAGKTKVVIAEYNGASNAVNGVALRIPGLSQTRIGTGQALMIPVTDRRALGPDPSKTLIILEQDGRRHLLKPEWNSALISAEQTIVIGDSKGVTDQDYPALLWVRVGREIIGKVNVHVFNPFRGEPAGVSEGLSLEIVDEVLPPEFIKATETSKQDIAFMNVLKEQSLKTGQNFSEYDPAYRYITLQTNGLDYKSEYTRIRFEQGGKSYILKAKDYALTVDNKLIVRLPNDFQVGTMQITIWNRGGDRLSVPVSKVLEITRAATF
jgi:hypothetical protein